MCVQAGVAFLIVSDLCQNIRGLIRNPITVNFYFQLAINSFDSLSCTVGTPVELNCWEIFPSQPVFLTAIHKITGRQVV